MFQGARGLALYAGIAQRNGLVPIIGNQRLGTLQRNNTENLKQIFPEKELRGLSPNFQIHVSVSDLAFP
jgi:hypothetical protein